MANTKPLASQSRYPGPGSLATRTVDDKLREFLSVKDFGAVGDGVVDDTTALQTAINAAASLNKPLCIPAGVYRITGPLNLRFPSLTNATTLTIFGDENLNTKIVMDNASATSVFVYDNGWKATTVSGCAVTSGSTALTTTGNFTTAGVQAGDSVAIKGNIGNTVASVTNATNIVLSGNSYSSASGLTATFYNTTATAKNALNIRNLFITNTAATSPYTTFHPALAMSFNGVVNSFFENIRIDGFTRGWNFVGGWINSFKNCKVWASREGFFVNLPGYLWSFDGCGTVQCGAVGYNASTFRFGGGLTFTNWIQENDKTSFVLESIRGAAVVGGNIETITYAQSIVCRAMPAVGGNDENYWTSGVTFQGLRIYNSLGFLFGDGAKSIRAFGNMFEWWDTTTVNAGYWFSTTGSYKDIDCMGNAYPPGYPAPAVQFKPVTPKFSAKLSTTQSITSSTFTKVALDTVEVDTNSNFSSSRFTPTVAGYYQISGQVYCTGTNTSLQMVAIYKNGAEYRRGGMTNISNIGSSSEVVSALVYLNGSTDYVEMYAYISATSPGFASNGGTNTYMTGVYVGQ